MKARPLSPRFGRGGVRCRTGLRPTGPPLPTNHGSRPVQLVASPDGKRLYVGNGRCSRRAGGRAGQRPSAVALHPARPGHRAGLVRRWFAALFVTTGVADGRLMVLDAATGEVRAAWMSAIRRVPGAGSRRPSRLRAQPFPQFGGRGRFGRRKPLTRIAVEREPVAAALTPDGKTLVVANHLPAGAATAPVVAAA